MVSPLSHVSVTYDILPHCWNNLKECMGLQMSPHSLGRLSLKLFGYM